MRVFYALLPLSLAACAAANTPETDNATGAEMATSDGAIAQDQPPRIKTPRQEARPGDLPPCPGINPDIRRPPGSNCLGIVPAQCGADRAQSYVGRQGSPVLRDELRKLARNPANGGFRWIPYGTAVIEDLRADRFNVELDEHGVVARIDCY